MNSNISQTVEQAKRLGGCSIEKKKTQIKPKEKNDLFVNVATVDFFF